MTPLPPTKRRFAPWWPAALTLWWLACGAIYLTLPPSPDQFEHGYMGWRILQGDVPYRDIIDMNWPGVMWMHALSAAAFGNQLWSWRALDIIFVALSAWFLQDLLKRSAGRTAAAVSLLLYPLFYAGLSQWNSGQHDMSASQMLLVALWFHVRAYELKSWRVQVGTGVFLAAAMLSKPTVGVLGVLFMLHAFWLSVPRWRVVQHTSVAALAAVAGLLLALLAVLAQGASLGDVIDAIYTYNIRTQFLEAATMEVLARKWVEVHLGSWHYLSILAAAGGIWLLWRQPRQPAAAALPVLWLGGVLSFLIQQRGFGYHLAPCFIAIVGLTSAALGMCLDIWRKSEPQRWTLLAGPLLTAIVVGGGVKKLDTNYPYLLPALWHGNYSLHLAEYQEGDGLTVADAVALTARIERDVPAGEPVLVVGIASSMNFLSRRPQPTRFFYAPVLANARPPLPMADRWIELFDSDLRRSMPRLCLVGRWARENWLETDSRSARVLLDFLSAHYRKTGVFGRDGAIDIYVRLQ